MWLHEFNGFDSYPIFSHKWKNLDGREIPWDTSMIFRIDCGRDLSNTAWIIYFIMRKMMLYHDLSWFIMIYDGLWWFMMIYDDLCTQKWQWHKSVLSISVPLNPITAPCHPWVSQRCWAGPLRNSTRVSLGAFQWSWGTATAPKFTEGCPHPKISPKKGELEVLPAKMKLSKLSKQQTYH